MMIMHLPTTERRLAEPTFATAFPPAFLTAALQLSELLATGYPREVSASELLPYNPAQLHDALDRMGIANLAQG